MGLFLFLILWVFLGGLFVCLFVCWDRLLLGSAGWLQDCSSPPATASQLLSDNLGLTCLMYCSYISWLWLLNHFELCSFFCLVYILRLSRDLFFTLMMWFNIFPPRSAVYSLWTNLDKKKATCARHLLFVGCFKAVFKKRSYIIVCCKYLFENTYFMMYSPQIFANVTHLWNEFFKSML